MTDDNKDVVLVRREIKPGKVDVLREWFEDRTDWEAVQAALRERGIRVESAFVHSTGDGDYLLYFAEADDFDAAMGEFETSDAEADRAYRDVVEETLVGGFEALQGTRAELLFHVVVQGDRR